MPAADGKLDGGNKRRARAQVRKAYFFFLLSTTTLVCSGVSSSSLQVNVTVEFVPRVQYSPVKKRRKKYEKMQNDWIVIGLFRILLCTRL